jgi:hypothetical protein
VKSSSAPRVSALTVAGLLTIGVAALTSVSLPGESLFREVTLLDLLNGAVPVDLPSLAYGGGLLLIGVGAVVIGLVLLVARVY